MNRPCITSSQVLSLQVSPKFISSCSPGCPPCANGKLVQQGACVYLTVTITVKYSRLATEIPAHPCLNTHVALSREQCHSEPCTRVWKLCLDDWTALVLSWSEFSSTVWKLKVFNLQGYKMSDRCSPLQVDLHLKNFLFCSHTASLKSPSLRVKKLHQNQSPLTELPSPVMLQQSSQEPAFQDRLNAKLAEADKKAVAGFESDPYWFSCE